MFYNLFKNLIKELIMNKTSRKKRMGIEKINNKKIFTYI